MGFSRQEYHSGFPFPSLRDRPTPGIEATSLVSPASAGGFFTTAPPGFTSILHRHFPFCSCSFLLPECLSSRYPLGWLHPHLHIFVYMSLSSAKFFLSLISSLDWYREHESMRIILNFLLIELSTTEINFCAIILKAFFLNKLDTPFKLLIFKMRKAF